MYKTDKKYKPILLSALALTQSVGTVMLVQNSIVQTYAVL